MDWFPSQTEKFPGLWTTSSTSWTSPSTGVTTMDSTVATSSNIAVRSPRKRSGLFDSELTDFSPEELQSVVNNQLQSTPSQSDELAGDLDLDFLPGQSDWMDLFGGLDCGGLVSPGIVEKEMGSVVATTNTGGDCGDFLSLQDGSFDDIEGMENFTDLSNAILGAGLEVLPEVPEPLPAVVASTSSAVVEPTPAPDSSSSTAAALGRRRAKRTAKAAALAVVPTEPRPVAATNHDHDDYTLKVKRPRVSVTEESDDESDVEVATTSSGMDKYTERRKKNNIASRRSRKSRKDKFLAMEERAESLEQENRELQEKVEQMEALAKALKQHLVTKLAK